MTNKSRYGMIRGRRYFPPGEPRIVEPEERHYREIKAASSLEIEHLEKELETPAEEPEAPASEVELPEEPPVPFEVTSELPEKTVSELREIASAQGVTGYTRLNKEELIKAIEGG